MSGDTQRAILAELAAGMQEITRLVGLDPESGEIEPTVERVRALAAAGLLAAPTTAEPTDRFTDMTARLAAADQAWAMQYCEPTAETDYIRFLAQHAFEPQPVKADVVTLCGSMRFWPQMLTVAAELTAAGSVVLAPFCVVAKEDQDGKFKAMLDALHQDKLRMAARHDGRVVVVSDESGYYGESTAREIAFALEMGLPVEYRTVASPAVPADDEAAPTMRTLHVTATRYVPEGHTDQRVRYEWEGDSWEAWFIAFGKGETGEEAYLMRDNGERWVVMADNITQVDSATALAALREGEHG